MPISTNFFRFPSDCRTLIEKHSKLEPRTYNFDMRSNESESDNQHHDHNSTSSSDNNSDKKQKSGAFNSSSDTAIVRYIILLIFIFQINKF